MTSAPDLILFNGRVLTLDDTRPRAQALAVAGGRIVAVGDESELRALAGPATRLIDAQGGTVLPGLIDSHVHAFAGSAERMFPDLFAVADLETVRARVRPFAEAHPEDRLVLAVNASYAFVGEGVPVTRQRLDDVLPDRPFAVMAADHHTLWANTAALELAGILRGRETPPGSEIVMAPDGTASGALLEPDAYGHVLRFSRFGGRELRGLIDGRDPDPAPTAEERARDRDVLEEGLRHAASLGLTSLQNMDGNLYQLRLLRELEDAGRLPVRMRVPLHLKPWDPLERLQEAEEMRRIAASRRVTTGTVKMFMDGVLDSYTANCIEPYPGRPDTCGEPLFAAEAFEEICVRADAMGLQIAVHAIGDGAVRRTLDGYAAARRVNGARDARHRIEHVEIFHPDDLPRFVELGVVASMQPAHAPPAGRFAPYPYGDILRERHRGCCFAFRRIRDAGVKLVFSTDWPVAPLDPLQSLRMAVAPADLGPDWPDQSLTLHQALAAYTRDNAWVEFAEDWKGRLTPGFAADLVVLSHDLEALEPADLDHARAVLTMCEGEITHTA